MTDLTVLGIALKNETIPLLLLYPQHTTLVLQLQVGAAEAYAISTVLYAGEAFKDPTLKDGTLAVNAPVERYFTPLQRSAAVESVPYFPGRTKNSPPWRPMTHDLTLDLIALMEGKLLATEITHVHQGTYYAELVVKTKHGIKRTPCRPADGVALAVRCGAVVRCHDDILAVAAQIEPVLESLPDTVRGFALTQLAQQAEQAKQQAQATQQTITLPIHAALQEAKKKQATVTIHFTPAAGGQTATANSVQSLMQTLHLEACAVPSFSLPRANEHALIPLGDKPEEAQWRALLQMLSPETKEPM